MSSQWSLDPARNEYYYYDSSEDVYVYQSGQKVQQHPPSPVSARIASPSSYASPPPPPPKPSSRTSGIATSQGAAPPRPPPPPSGSGHFGNSGAGTHVGPEIAIAQLPPAEDGWLPGIIKDKSTPDLHKIASDQSLQQALVHAPETSYQSLKSSSEHLQSLLQANLNLANQLTHLESQLQSSRQHTQTRLLTVRALKSQFDAKQSSQDAALRDFSPRGLFQRLAVAVGEQEQLCRGLEESFLDGDNVASEREVGDFIRRMKETRKAAYLRRERKERWDEGRIGGLRG